MKRAENTSDPGSTNVMTEAVLKAGLITQAQLEEMKRWAPPSLTPDATVEPLKSLDEAVKLVGDALQSSGYVLMRETDLESVRQYLETTTRGMLHIELDGETIDGTYEPHKEDIEVTFGRTPIGEYIIAWRSESIREELANGFTYLIDNGTRVFFRDVRELFFGGTKAFMVCVPSAVDHAV